VLGVGRETTLDDLAKGRVEGANRQRATARMVVGEDSGCGGKRTGYCRRLGSGSNEAVGINTAEQREHVQSNPARHSHNETLLLVESIADLDQNQVRRADA
jgi:hypothetical protein